MYNCEFEWAVILESLGNYNFSGVEEPLCTLFELVLNS